MFSPPSAVDFMYCRRSGSWPPKSKRALGKNTLTFWMVCISQTMDKYPELLYEEWKGKKPCLIQFGQMISHMARNLEMTQKLAISTFNKLLPLRNHHNVNAIYFYILD